MLFYWYKSGLPAMTVIIALLASFGLRGINNNSKIIIYPPPMAQSAALETEQSIILD